MDYKSSSPILVWLGKIIVCVAAVLVSHGLFSHYLEITPVNTVNPIKLIVRVLCYARKHKYPENRIVLRALFPFVLDYSTGNFSKFWRFLKMAIT